MSAALRLEALACVRGGRTLFRHLDLTLGSGGAALVTGPNGAGKSSLLRVVAGLLPSAGGAVVAEGGIALADEALALDRERPLGAALAFWARLDGSASLAGAMEVMGLEALATVPVRILSTGQRKRAALARLLASGKRIWLLDEPANGLDAASLARLEDAVSGHRRSGGIVLVATHQPVALPDAIPIALNHPE